MYPFLVLMICLLLADALFEFVLDLLNLKRLKSVLPLEAAGIYDPAKYALSQKYYKTNQKFSWISTTFGLTLTLILLLSGGFGWLDELLRQYTRHPVALALLFFGIIFLGAEVMGIPFQLYKTFVIEGKYGFNKTTIGLFIADKVKGLVLGTIVGGGILSALVLIFIHTTDSFWWLAWISVSVILLLATMFYASWIIPLFNKLTPLPEGELRSAIENYSRKTGFHLNNIFVMDGSKRSAKANAFFSGLGKNKKIVLFDTLIQKHSTDELIAVLAHEIGHYQLKHTRTGLFLSLLQTGLMFFLLSFFLGNLELASALGAKEASFHLNILAFGILYTPLSKLLSIVMNRMSRKHEYEADAFARKTTNAGDLVSALKKLSVDNLSNLTPHPAYVFVHYSHPPLLNRIKALQAESG
ncbi:MAG TPA: M48 family metallopeptidase [Bacteroidia bacterium]|nr:M48 family metallopeptidase [Bacteroidia bacterium]